MIYISHLLDDKDMTEIFKGKDLGLESIEFSIGYCLDKFEKSLTAYRRRIEAMGHKALNIHGPFLDLNPASNDTLIRRATRQRFQQAYEAARRLEAGKIIYHTCFVPRVNFLEGWVDLAVPFWKEFLEDKGNDIQICMENVFDPEYEILAEVVREVNHPAFSLCLDVGHANHASKTPITQWIEGLAPWIGHVHIHDNDGITDSHQAIGEGSIPWHEVLKALHDFCPQTDCTIENVTREAVEKTLACFTLY